MSSLPILAASPVLQNSGRQAGGPVEPTIDLWRLVSDPQAWSEQLVLFLPNLGKSLGVLFVFMLILVVTRPALRKVFEQTNVEEGLSRFLIDSLYFWAVLILGLVMAAAQLGIDVGAAVAGLGVAGIAIGLAAQDSLANAIAGITIFLDKPFKVGDWITAGDVTGRVSEIKVRTTRVRTRNNTYLVVPNKTITENTLVNLTLYGDVRVDIPVGIAYKEDVRAARKAILAAVEAVELVRPNRSEVVLDAFGDSSLDLMLRVWVDDPEKETLARFACLEVAKNALDREGIQIPFPHLQMFLEKLEPEAVEGIKRAMAG